MNEREPMTPGQRAIIATIREAGMPVTRRNYIETNWPDVPEPWTPEHEAELPEFLQEKSGSEEPLS